MQVAEVCRKNGAADVKLVYADLTDPKETKKLGEVRMSSCSSGSSLPMSNTILREDITCHALHSPFPETLVLG